MSNKPTQGHGQGTAEGEVYDLDDPNLKCQFLHRSEGHNSANAGSRSTSSAPAKTFMCRFRAIPVNEPHAFTRNIGQYGQVLFESRNKLIMRVPCDNHDLLNRIRQIWVSKYLTPAVDCIMTFDSTGDSRGATVIIQRAVSQVNIDSKDGITVDNTPAKDPQGQAMAVAAPKTQRAKFHDMYRKYYVTGVAYDML